ncbi:MAG: hydantoinase/oxoprolinase family protein, partial [Deltaproteobacteria bacterium]|nr:hydantoinase/oxoprolinase family protein [Deltaproteobacteria bacterium]
KETGYANVIVTDMGGTTLDVATIEAGEVAFSHQSEVVRQLAHLRKVDVESVGAGGGSIAWVHEDSRSLRVGPRSAGALPGPICYGRGGREVTVTDADLVLGILSPDRPLAGGLELDADAARRAVGELGEGLGLSPEECAAGIVEIVDSRMEDLIRRVTVQRGADPRRFTLWAFGGASGAHAGLYGRGIGVEEVVFPLNDLASVWSGYGLTTLDHARSFEASTSLRTPLDLATLGRTIDALESRARGYAERVGLESAAILRQAGMKYPLQVHELEVDAPGGPIDAAFAEALVARFHRAYEARFGLGTGYRDAGAEITSLRVTIRAPTDAITLNRETIEEYAPEPVEARSVYWREERARVPTSIYAGSNLRPGARLSGPAVLEYPHTTIAVRPGQSLRADPFGHLVLRLVDGTRGGGAREYDEEDAR